jgi:hypothetical protein
MTPEEAQEAFFKMYTMVFEDDNHSPETRALRLEASIKELLSSKNLPETTKLSDPFFTDTSKV